MLEQTDQWRTIVKAAKSRHLGDVAREFGFSPGQLSAALRRAGVKRTPVPAEGAPDPGGRPKGPTRPAKAAPTVVNGLECRPGTNDAALAKHRRDLGQVADREIAERVGVRPRTVAAFRRRHRIKSVRVSGATRRKSAGTSTPGRKEAANEKPVTGRSAAGGSDAGGSSAGARAPSTEKKSSPGRRSKVAPFHDRVGKEPDGAIAKRAGVGRNAVARYRQRHNIPPYTEYLKSQEAAEAAAATPAQPTAGASPASPRAAAPVGRKVYRVTFKSDRQAFVVATSLVDAARQVEGHDDVLGFMLAGDLLG